MDMRIRDVMQGEVKTASPGTRVEEAHGIMRDGGFRHLPVIDELGYVLGIVSERDLRQVGAVFKDPVTGLDEFLVTQETTVDQIMIPEPVTVSPDDSVAKAVKLIRDKRIGCLVVTHAHRIVGIVSYLDLLDAAMAEQEAPRTAPASPEDTQPLDKKQLTDLRQQIEDDLAEYRAENPTLKVEEQVVKKRSTQQADIERQRKARQQNIAEANSSIMDEIARQLEDDKKQ
jgi:acetoin utilization protein AcuB